MISSLNQQGNGADLHKMIAGLLLGEFPLPTLDVTSLLAQGFSKVSCYKHLPMGLIDQVLSKSQ